MPRTVLSLTLMLAVVAPAAAREKPAAKSSGSYVHVVIFTMKKDTPATAVNEVIKDCHKMLAKISTVRSVKVGRPAEQATPKYAKKNYDLALVVLVDDFEGLKAYLDDPVHVAFVKKHERSFQMDKLQVFDFVDGK